MFIQRHLHLLVWLRVISSIFLIILLSACCEWSCVPDPVCCNRIPPKSSCMWLPLQFCPMVPCDNSCEEMDPNSVNRQKKLEVVDLIDIALHNNPTTQQTWADARAAAYFVGVAESALYPDINAQETLSYVDIQLDDEMPMVAAAAAAAANAGANTATTSSLNGNAAGAYLQGQRSLKKSLSQQEIRQVVPPTPTPTTPTGVAATGTGSNVILNSDISLSYLLLDFGGRQASIEAARQALYASDWIHNRQFQEVIVSVLQNYYAYSGLIDLLKARESDLANAKANLDAAQQLFEAGIKTRLDVLQAQTDLVNIELNIVDLQGQSRITLGNLITNLGLPANTELNIANFPENAPLAQISQDIDELIEVAKDHRPDLYAAYANHEQRRAEVTVARSAGLPTLSTNLDWQSNIYSHNPSLNNRIFRGSLIVDIPIFNGFYYVNQTRRAQELLRASCAEIRARELGVILDVITSYYNFKTAVKSLNYSEEYLVFSLEAYDAALLSYREGIGTILDLLSAQRALANARSQKVQSRTRWIISLANIAFATGILGEDQPCH